MDFLGKDKLGRLEDEIKQRRQARGEEAQKRLQDVGKQTQQLVQDQLAPARTNPDGSLIPNPGIRVGGLSRVLYEQATGQNAGSDGRRGNRRNKRLQDMLGVQAEGQRALSTIDNAVSTISNAVTEAGGAGLHGGLESAAKAVTN